MLKAQSIDNHSTLILQITRNIVLEIMALSKPLPITLEGYVSVPEIQSHLKTLIMGTCYQIFS